MDWPVDAFHNAYLERRTRMQQASQILSQSAQHLTQFVQAIDNNLPTIRTDQSLMQGQTRHMLAPDEQASILNEESQAQNAILMALQTLNYQLETLAEEVRDCPEEQDENSPAWNQPYYNKSEGDGAGETPEGGFDNPPGNWQIVPREEDPFDLPPSDSTPETFENNGFEASLYPDGELQIPWIDRLSQLLNLRSLVEWLGDRVQTIKAYVTDGFYKQYFATDELTQETMQRLNNMVSTIGFRGSIQKEGARTWIIFIRTK